VLSGHLDLSAGPLPELHAVTFLHLDRHQLAGVITRAGSDGNDLALHRLLFGRVGNNDAASGLGLFVDATHDHAIVQRAKLHGLYLTPIERIFLSFWQSSVVLDQLPAPMSSPRWRGPIGSGDGNRKLC